MLKLLLTLVAVSIALQAGTAVLEGKKVHYVKSGGGSRTLVLVHGWTCDHTFWSAQAADFAGKYRVLAVDLPGHGQSDPAETYSMALFARAVEAVMRQEKVARATLMGHSMGGAVLLEFARQFPEKLEAAVLVDAFMAGPDVQTPAKWIDSMQGPAGLEARRKMVTGMYSAATSDAVKAQIERVMLQAPEPVAVGAMRGMFAPEVWKAGQVQARALAVVAKPAQITEASLRARWPNLTYRAMDGVGHFLMMEKPKEFNAIVQAWLDGR